MDEVESAKDAAARKAREAAQDASGYVRDRAHDVEHGVAAAGSAALGTASAGEEKVGHALKEAGKRLEKDGSQAKHFYRGEEVKEETNKKWGCSVM